MGVSQKQDYGSYTQWNLDIPKRQLGTGKNLFAITRFPYIEVLFDIFYYNWGKENRSLYRGLT